MSDNKIPQQKITDGVGHVYHRVYSVVFPRHLKTQLTSTMQVLMKDPNRFSPQLLARFEKIKGPSQRLEVGDEFLIHILGPWNGPVRVDQVRDDYCHMITLEGHLEAGEIVFRSNERPDGNLEFSVESLARSRDAVVDFLYDKVPIAKLAQTEMWSSYCKSVAEDVWRSTGEEPIESPEVQILTERLNRESGQWEKF